jgi:L-alanine-DL-glutamate epimerase-like enolase superfamily enzyme
VRLDKLPGWVVDDDTSVRREVEGLVGLTIEERWTLTCLCARDALWAARQSHDPAKVFAFEDPLPPSTLTALARLRARRAPR